MANYVETYDNLVYAIKYKNGNTKILLQKTLQNGEIVNYWLSRKRSEENKRKISEAMKLAHKEHRAHNIGQSRWNNEPSYPEKFFL